MKKPKKLKIVGIKMTVVQWFNLMKDPYRTFALEEIKGDNYSQSKYVTSLSSALNKFNWERSKKGRAYWEPIVRDLQSGVIKLEKQYVDSETITQMID